MVKKADIPRTVVDAAMTLAAERGWRRVSLADIATAGKMSLAALYQHYPSRMAVLREASRLADVAMLEVAGKAGFGAGDSPRDRLFDVLMARLDALGPWRGGLAAVARDLGRGPFVAAGAALCLGPGLERSMGWALEAAGISTAGPAGRCRRRALVALWLSLLPVWFRDDGGDTARTMAGLDRRLSRAERWARGPRARRADAAAEDEGAPEAA